eukprot:1160868-Pelagomonas_calceolata.AAC.5
MEDAAAQSEPPGRALQPPSRVLPSFPSRLARVTQRLMPMFKGDSGEDQGEQMKGKEGGGLGEMDPENSSINHNGMPQRTDACTQVWMDQLHECPVMYSYAAGMLPVQHVDIYS